MPIFQYRGYKPDGSSASGTVEADGLSEAVLNVRELGVYPKEVSEYIPKGAGAFKRSDAVLLPYVTRQLATLLGAGVPLIESLRSLAEESKGGWKHVLLNVRERVSGGESLSRSLEGQGKVFPGFYVNLVSAGEESGALDKVLLSLSDFLEQEAAIKARIRAAMTYPAFMVSVGFVVLAFLFVFVIPKIVKIFETTKSALPLITVVLIGVSNFFLNYWWLVIIALLGAVTGARRLNERHRQKVDALKLRAPGNVIQSLYYTRFARTLGFLLKAGLPMLKALELTAKSIGNTVLEVRVSAAAKRVGEGARLSQSLEGFPPVLLQLISTGERSGRLAEVLGSAANSYEEEFTRRVQRALSLLEPGMILVMGLAVGFIVMAVLLPLFQLNQLIK
ncbi:MAG: type II secretion system F family protein [Thermodesulfovibrionales bacterium]|nr:type II secretion system F family protein [Thermodesulfovibrionales bacterium]